MTLSNVNSWIKQAQREGYAIGAFNANTLEQVQAIVRAAQEENAPVIVQVSHHALQYVGGGGKGSEIIGLRYMAEIGKVAAHSVNVPVALHLDHADENEVVQAIALGFTSVMFDGGELAFDHNIVVTRRLRDLAWSVGVFIEAEVGAVPRPNSTGKVEHMGDLTDPEDAAEFVEATEVDALAIALGSIHTMTEKSVRIDLERLQAIRARVDIPLVLHGSSGVTDDYIAQGIKLGLSKVNVSTQLNKVFSAAARATLDQDKKIVDPRKYLAPAREAMIAAVRERIRFFGSAGKA